LNSFIPKELHSDNGSEFRNNKISSLCIKFKIRQIFGRPYHPESQGMVERFNFTIKRMLVSVMTHDNNTRWCDKLKSIVYEYNIKYNRSINNSPVTELFGYSGFNVDANLLIEGNTPQISTLSIDKLMKLKVLDIIIIWNWQEILVQE
jgi:hypothetical protein